MRARDAGAAIWADGDGGAGAEGATAAAAAPIATAAAGQSGRGGAAAAAAAGGAPAQELSGGGGFQRLVLQWEGLMPLAAGSSVEVFWPDDGLWYPATVLLCDLPGRSLQLLYGSMQVRASFAPLPHV